MKAFGITFKHRRGYRMDAPYVAQDFAEFFAFASVLASLGAERAVKSVFFCHNAMAHEVTMATGADMAIPLVIEVANRTLNQAIVDGCAYGKVYREEW